MAQVPDDSPETRLARLVLALRSQGVSDPKVLQALEATPRQMFTPDLFQERAFEDSALPIACGQTISQPFIVGLMTQALKIEPRARVLEIGTGSGYQTAILSRMARLVYTVERYRTLLAEAEARFKALGLTNVITRFGDGGLGWPEQAPFDRIMVTAAAPDEPAALLAQLKPNGILVAPIGRGPVQILRRYCGDGKGGFVVEDLGEVRFVPLLDGVAREL
ncbi:MAG: protein-L-isoaspartate(D-aspartate) O-methyltransferase [Phenylobacterium sp.]|uniref:protein-L-isoaspartate(D-aspartate) O-methyltransferase n=1 Tax=Phenylobacterium sp. TaxID=1871053 RepID=UPI002735E190|nr:protein-L-isoaspartate(D-aspartate) O-methyltransferase [Phenylobacterium sp.]MDP1643525.1 protein-L-isoaspartate(D-aspartate) O-methyltransferase [Phenylobacterium sp.]MDP3117522.1 protein-L-isoaspartate(D-aspartate) O-methyltransferase [Phenylobacterium sp.]